MSAPQKTTNRIVPEIAVLGSVHDVNKGAATTPSARRRAADKLRKEAAKKDNPEPTQFQLQTITEQTQPSEQDLLTQDRARSNAERHLLNITIALPRACHLDKDLLRDMAELFKDKDSLPTSEDESYKDDYARRQAVYQIMKAREVNLWERKGESAYWAVTAGRKFDMRTALVSKFNSKANEELKGIFTIRNSQKRLLEWSKTLDDKGGIPKEALKWLQTTINATVCPPYSSEAVQKKSTTARLRAVYYIMACRRDAGLEPFTPEYDPVEDAVQYQIHQSLMTMPKEAFQDDATNFDMVYGIELGMDHLMSRLPKGDKEEGMEEMIDEYQGGGLSQPLARLTIQEN